MRSAQLDVTNIKSLQNLQTNMSRNLSLARYIFKKSQRNRSEAFCKCVQETDLLGNIIATHCDCGENVSNILNWTWKNDEDLPEVKIEGNIVTFHPIYSQGTALVRGNKSLDKQMIHYWEVKIVSSMSGTDLVRIFQVKFTK